MFNMGLQVLCPEYAEALVLKTSQKIGPRLTEWESQELNLGPLGTRRVTYPLL